MTQVGWFCLGVGGRLGISRRTTSAIGLLVLRETTVLQADK